MIFGAQLARKALTGAKTLLRRGRLRKVQRRSYSPAERRALGEAFERFLQADIDDDYAESTDERGWRQTTCSRDRRPDDQEPPE